MNNVTLLGNLTKVPQIRKTSGGTSVCNFTLAVSESYKKGDETVKNTTFVNCEVWGWGTECLEGLTTKDRIVVNGSLKSFVASEGEKPQLCVKAASISVVPYNKGKKSSPSESRSEELEVVGQSSGGDIPF